MTKRNKIIIYIIGVILFIGLLSAGVYLFFNNQHSNKTQEAPSLSYSKGKVEEVSSTSSSEKETSPSSSEEQTAPTEYRILDHLDEIKNTVKKLNDFSNGTTHYWNSVRKEMTDKWGISVSDNTKGGFGVFDVGENKQENVLSGIVTEIKYEKVSDTEVKFRLTARTGRAGVVDNDLDYTAKEVRSAIKRSGRDVVVDYTLTINPDGKTGTLTHAGGQWW